MLVVFRSLSAWNIPRGKICTLFFFMEYYIFSNAINPAEVGPHYPQTKSRGTIKVFRNGILQGSFPSFGPISAESVFPEFQLHYRAKLTDIISDVVISGSQQLVSLRFWELIQTIRSMPFQSFDTVVNHRGKEYPYKVVLYTEYHDEYIDLNASTFRFDNMVEVSKVVNGADVLDELFSYKKLFAESKHYNLYRPLVSELYLNESAIELDFFRVLTFGSRKIISAHFKHILEKEKITGWLAQPATGSRI
jgi:hypothetical protein